MIFGFYFKKIWSIQKKAVLLQPISVERLNTRLALGVKV